MFECPTCERTFDKEQGMKVHHKRTHDESIAGVQVTCYNCGDSFRRPRSRAEKYHRHFCSRNCFESHRLQSPARIELDSRGYKRWRVLHDGEEDTVYVHQLLAIAKGADPNTVFGENHNVTHHKNGLRWDNRPSNIEVMSHQEHVWEHHSERFGHDKTPWRDKDRLQNEIQQHSVSELAKKWPCDGKTIYNWLDRFDIQPPTKQEAV